MTKPFDPTKPVKKRNSSRPVRIICTDAKSMRPILALVTGPNGVELMDAFLPDGRKLLNAETDEDLVNTPEKRKVWLRVWFAMGGCPYARAYDNEEDANMNAGPGEHIVEVEIEV